MRPTVDTVAVVATGVIGRSWGQLFARAGCQTRLYDSDPGSREQALEWLEQDLEADRVAGVITAEEARARRARMTVHSSLADAFRGVGYVQESGPEQLEAKQAMYRAMDEVAEPDVIIGSSTSTFDMSAIAAGLPGARRCIVAHPVNPPHVIPAVEVLPGTETEPAVLERTCAFLASVGQTPVRMNRYVFGFLMNRMQVALIREAINLVNAGVADVEAVDAVIQDGIGMRWALMGPFGVANTNADGGVRDYFTRFRQTYLDLSAALEDTIAFDPPLIEELGRRTDIMVQHAPRADIRAWRDRMVRKIRQLKQEDPYPRGT